MRTEKVVSVLKNWQELGFKSEVAITRVTEEGFEDIFTVPLVFIYGRGNFGTAYSKSLNSMKARVKKENSWRGSPRFKWKDLKDNQGP